MSREVDRHRQIEAGIAPLTLLAQGLGEHPSRDRVDELGALDLGHGAGGREQAIDRMVPAAQ